jgi:hypothetical protein
MMKIIPLVALRHFPTMPAVEHLKPPLVPTAIAIPSRRQVLPRVAPHVAPLPSITRRAVPPHIASEQREFHIVLARSPPLKRHWLRHNTLSWSEKLRDELPILLRTTIMKNYLAPLHMVPPHFVFLGRVGRVGCLIPTLCALHGTVLAKGPCPTSWAKHYQSTGPVHPTLVAATVVLSE